MEQLSQINLQLYLVLQVNNMIKHKLISNNKNKSGSGKTTLLNFLSGRLCSPNMTTMGNLFLNGKTILDLEDYSN